MSKEKFQRVRVADAEKMLEDLIKNFDNPYRLATIYEEDYAEASYELINRSVINDLLKKICRP